MKFFRLKALWGKIVIKFFRLHANKASNWQIVAQIKLYADLCDGISLYRQNTRPVAELEL